MTKIFLASTTSTNDYLKELSERLPLPDWSVVRAGFQTKGRGQRGKQWESDSDANLLMSLWLRPLKIRSAHSFDLNRLVCVAILDLLESHGLQGLEIKWPNDILCNRKKIAGVLIENSISSSSVETSIIGIGLNVNQGSFDTPESGVTSMCLETKQPVDPARLEEELLARLEELYNHYDREILQKRYWASLYGSREEFPFNVSGELRRGLIQYVTDEGQLIVKDNTGINTYQFQQIQFSL